MVANDDVFGLYRLVLFSRFHCSLKQCLITREIDRIESPKYHTLKMRLNAPFLFFPAHIVICGLFYTSEVIVYRLYYAMGFFFNFLKIISFLAVLGLHCCSGFSLLVVASLIAEHGPWGRKAGEFFTTEPQGKPHCSFLYHTPSIHFHQFM